jgi:hypothetical protein
MPWGSFPPFNRRLKAVSIAEHSPHQKSDALIETDLVIDRRSFLNERYSTNMQSP